jgi:hypothetical protein
MTNDPRSLILKRDPVGQNPEDYSVLEDGVVIGRIFKVPVAPPDRPWMWASGHSAATVKRAAHGYEPTREAAMGAFAKSWRRDRPPCPLSGDPDIVQTSPNDRV